MFRLQSNYVNFLILIISLCYTISYLYWSPLMTKSLVPALSNVQKVRFANQMRKSFMIFIHSGWQYINSDILITNEPTWQTDSLATWRNCYAAIFFQHSNRSGVSITASSKRYKAFSSTIAPNAICRDKLSWAENKRWKLNVAYNLSNLYWYHHDSGSFREKDQQNTEIGYWCL